MQTRGYIISTWMMMVVLYWAMTAVQHVQGVDESCSDAVQAVASAAGMEVAKENVLPSMSSSASVGGVCGLEMSCCTSGAEQILRDDVSQRYQDTVQELLQETIPGCANSSLPADAAVSLEAVKVSLVQTIQILLQDDYLPEFDSVFDSLFEYAANGIASQDLCELEEEYQAALFESYLLGFKSILQYDGQSTAILDNSDFRNCFYDYFMEVHGETIADSYHRLEQRYNLYLRHLQALATSDEALENVVHHVLSPECRDSLLRMTHCAQCGGVDSSSVRPCKSLCQNVQQGCLVDLYELGVAYQELYYVMEKARDELNEYDPISAMALIRVDVLNLLDDFRDGHQAVADPVSSRCGVSFSSRKRSMPQSRAVTGLRSRKLARRESVSPLNLAKETLKDTVTCAQSIYMLLQDLAAQTCAAHNIDSDDQQCWNGTDVGSYCPVPTEKDRLSQAENPEVELTNTSGLLYLGAIAQLKNATSQLRECAFNVEGCAIKLCNFTIPSPLDYNLATETRYAPLTFNTEQLSASTCLLASPALTQATSVILQTLPVVAMTPTAATGHTAQIPMATSTPTQRASTTTSTPILRTSPMTEEQLEVSGSAITSLSSALFITSLLVAILSSSSLLLSLF